MYLSLFATATINAENTIYHAAGCTKSVSGKKQFQCAACRTVRNTLNQRSNKFHPEDPNNRDSLNKSRQEILHLRAGLTENITENITENMCVEGERQSDEKGRERRTKATFLADQSTNTVAKGATHLGSHVAKGLSTRILLPPPSPTPHKLLVVPDGADHRHEKKKFEGAAISLNVSAIAASNNMAPRTMRVTFDQLTAARPAGAAGFVTTTQTAGTVW